MPDVEEAAGKTFDLPILVGDISSESVISYKFTLIFNPSILSAADVIYTETMTAVWQKPSATITEGAVQVEASGSYPLSGGGTLIKIRFQVNSNASVGTTISLAFAQFQFNNGTPSAKTSQGSFTIIRDIYPPVIVTGPTVNNVTANSATITWETDEPTAGTLEYGLTEALGVSKKINEYRTNHQVKLTNLTPAKTYHYKVQCTDASGNGPVESEILTFYTSNILLSLPQIEHDPGTTVEIPLTTTDLTGLDVTQISATILFDQSVLTFSHIETSKSMTNSWRLPQTSAKSGEASFKIYGTSVLTGSGTVLRLVFKVNPQIRLGTTFPLTFAEAELNEGEISISTVNGRFEVKDTTLPYFSTEPYVDKMASNSALIRWQTNELTESTLNFGKASGNYQNSQQSHALTKDHWMLLSGLQPQTDYFFRINSIDSTGNGPVVSDEYSFQTRCQENFIASLDTFETVPGNQVIMPVHFRNAPSADIKEWFCVVKFNPQHMSAKSISVQNTLMASWPTPITEIRSDAILIRGSGGGILSDSGILFNLNFVTKSQIQNVTYSDVEIKYLTLNKGFPKVTTFNGRINFIIDIDTSKPQILFGPIVDNHSATGASVFWITDQLSTSQVKYGADNSYGQSVYLSALTTEHLVHINNLSPNSTYHFKVASSNQYGGDPVVSRDATFQTTNGDEIRIAVPTVRQTPGSVFELPIKLNQLNDHEITRLSFTLNFSSGLLIAGSASTSGTVAASWSAPQVEQTSNQIKIQMSGAAALPDTGTILNIKFQAKTSSQPGSVGIIYFSDGKVNNETIPGSYSHGLAYIVDGGLPEITEGPEISLMNPGMAFIFWETEESAISLIEYGPTPDFGAEIRSDFAEKSHIFELSGLKPGTTYYYQVSAWDVTGNGPVKSTVGTFQTAARPDIVLSLSHVAYDVGQQFYLPIGINGLSSTNTMYTADFTLNYDSGVLKFDALTGVGAITSDWTMSAETTSDTTLAVHLKGNWQVDAEGDLVKLQMTPRNPSRYDEVTQWRILNASIDEIPYGVQTLNGTFTLRKKQNSEIVLGPTADKVTQNGAQIVWFTNKTGTSTVEYGETGDYGLTLGATEQTTTHNISIYGLKPSTTYHFRTKTTLSNTEIVSEDQTFTTSSGNQIEISVHDTTLAIGKTFSLPVFVPDLTGRNIQQVAFQAVFNPDYLSPGAISTENTLTSAWTVTTNQLTPGLIQVELKSDAPISGSGKLVEIQGVAKNESENNSQTQVLLGNATFNYGLIPGSTEHGILNLTDLSMPQFVEEPDVYAITPTSARIQWSMDELTTGSLEFGPDSVVDQTWQVRSLRKDHEETLTNLIPGTIYTYRIAMYDANGNGPFWSPFHYFKTEYTGIQLRVPELNFGIGEIYDVPLFIEGLKGEEVLNYSFQLDFDGSKLVPIRVHSENSLSQNWNAHEFTAGINSIQVSQTGETPITEDGILTWLTFMASPKATVGEKGWFNFSKIQVNNIQDSLNVGGAEFEMVAKHDQTQIQVSLPENTLTPGAWCQVPVYITNLTNRGIFTVNFEIEYSSSMMICDSVVRAGQIISQSARIESSHSKNKIAVSIVSPAPLQGEGVMIRLLFKVNEDAESGQSSDLKISSFQLNGGRYEVNTIDGKITLFHWPDIIMGVVVERNLITPIPGASVKLKGQNNDTELTIETDNNGRFIFSGLDTSQTNLYRVTVSKSGYSKPDPLYEIIVGRSALRIPLLKPDGEISGKILTPNGFPVHDAEIIVNDFQGTDAAHYATTQSDVNGEFKISDLNREYGFRLTVQKEGFKKLTLNQLFADTTLNLVPDPYFSTISGQISVSGTTGTANVKVKLIDSLTATTFDSVYSDSSGYYTLDNVVAGEYQIVAAKPGLVALNTPQLIEVAGGASMNINPAMEIAVLDFFEIRGNTFVGNDERSRYKYRAQATTGQTMELPKTPNWRLSPSMAGTINNGALIPNPNYLGETAVILNSDEYNVSDSLHINLFAQINPDTDIELWDALGFSLTISPGTVAEDTMIYISHETLPQLELAGHVWKSMGQSYNIQPRELLFNQPVTMTFPIVAIEDSTELRIGHWDFRTGQWRIINDYHRLNSNLVEFSINEAGLYTQLDASQGLAILDIKLIPNPFSTEVDSDNDGKTGLAIHFVTSSKYTARPFVTIKIYNLLGDLVRELLVQEPVEKMKLMVVHWDGYTDHHLLARNGRYLLRFIIEDSSGKKEYLKSIVLVK